MDLSALKLRIDRKLKRGLVEPLTDPHSTAQRCSGLSRFWTSRHKGLEINQFRAIDDEKRAALVQDSTQHARFARSSTGRATR
jgi:hypothetical protein